ncbi:helix-turn-helix transcriptional regulator [Rhodococcus sp. 14C212]|uniref:TetR family transcriptional regulator n=1 Tax=Rhodococcus sp. 14C212 TaxID=2711209 RepID=UPI0013EC5A1B|nr:helix-turn-helix transcriptional regulator [Rhodococcus sp. 14C212]
MTTRSAADTGSHRRRGGRGARERILAAAAELFYVEGINATGVELIATKAEVSKRTLYKHFPSKTVLVERYLEQAGLFLPDPANSGKDTDGPRARLIALFEIPEYGGSHMRGCPFHNAAVEAAGTMPEVENMVHEHKRTFIAAITELCREFGAAEPALLGNQLALLYEGAAALSTSLDDPTPWTYARETAQILLDHPPTTVAP